MPELNGLTSKIMLVVITAVVTSLASLALMGADGISRGEVKSLVAESEARSNTQIAMTNAQLATILNKLDLVSQEQIRLSTKMDILVKGAK